MIDSLNSVFMKVIGVLKKSRINAGWQMSPTFCVKLPLHHRNSI